MWHKHVQDAHDAVISNINKDTIYFLVKCQLIFDFNLQLSSVSERNENNKKQSSSSAAVYYFKVATAHSFRNESRHQKENINETNRLAYRCGRWRISCDIFVTRKPKFIGFIRCSIFFHHFVNASGAFIVHTSFRCIRLGPSRKEVHICKRKERNKNVKTKKQKQIISHFVSTRKIVPTECVFVYLFDISKIDL